MTKGRLALACGGTLGHVTPALAVADAWALAHPEAPPLLCTVRGDPQIEAVIKSGHEYVAFSAAPFARRNFIGRIKSGIQLIRGIVEARRCFRKRKIGAVLSFGGYAGAAPVLAARSLQIASFVHEGNAKAGLSNRLAVAAGATPLVAWADAILPWPRAQLVGFPIRDPEGRAHFPEGELITIVVTGGSSGAPILDSIAPSILAATGLGKRLRILHQTSPSATVGVAQTYENLKLDADVVSFVPDLPAALAEAAFSIACPGAATLAELAAVNLPSLLVPREDVAYRHHHLNARAYASNGAALVLESPLESPNDLTSAAAETAAILCDERKWSQFSEGAEKLHRGGAAKIIVQVIESAVS